METSAPAQTSGLPVRFSADRGRDHSRGGDDGADVRAIGLVDGRRHGDDVNVGASAILRIGSELQRGLRKCRSVHLTSAVVTLAKLANASFVDIEADGAELAGERDGERQADIAKTDHDDAARLL